MGKNNISGNGKIPRVIGNFQKKKHTSSLFSYQPRSNHGSGPLLGHDLNIPPRMGCHGPIPAFRRCGVQGGSIPPNILGATLVEIKSEMPI